MTRIPTVPIHRYNVGDGYTCPLHGSCAPGHVNLKQGINNGALPASPTNPFPSPRMAMPARNPSEPKPIAVGWSYTDSGLLSIEAMCLVLFI